MNIGDKITYLRRNAKLTQAELAEKIGVSSKTLRHWELGNFIPKIESIQNIAQALNVPVTELLDDTPAEKNMPQIQVVPTQERALQETNTGIAVLTLETGRKVEVPATAEGYAFLKDLFAMSLKASPAVTA